MLGILPGKLFCAQSEQISRVLAKVGNEVITTAELDQFLKPWLMKYGEQFNKNEFAGLTQRARQAALKQFIERKLLTQEADATKLEIPDVEIQKEIDCRSLYKSSSKTSRPKQMFDILACLIKIMMILKSVI